MNITKQDSVRLIIVIFIMILVMIVVWRGGEVPELLISAFGNIIIYYMGVKTNLLGDDNDG